ncbi:winged helix-turn-helix domain-containing protein [Photobacterium nomapromontoriensis]|uniref:winged helix-turn-helix domain-containing protein n=1 Tax=Photobacterium nomapromontoriensis TaxID=2910237 RepID=UPI003D0C61C8
MMHGLQSDHYQFDDFLYSPTEGVVVKSNQRIMLKGRENELLHILVKQHPHAATRDVIQCTLWNNSYVTDSTINQAIKTLRDDLNDTERTLIRTIPKTGYILGASPTFIAYKNINIRQSKRQRFIYLPIVLSWLLVGFIAFYLGSQVGIPSLPGPTEIDGKIVYMFAPSAIEKARFTAHASPKVTTYIEHTEIGYRYCEYNNKVMRCKNIL